MSRFYPKDCINYSHDEKYECKLRKSQCRAFDGCKMYVQNKEYKPKERKMEG
jgi:hypothetical protein